MPILPPCAVTVLVCGLPAARVTDMSMSVPPPPPPVPHPIVKGSMTVLITGLPAARIGDMCAMGGSIIMGAPTVITGG
ncbi:PAAR domain-containing protein [Pseudopelagicola sp. nBUS_19]|uniref:PAAR domain-containing protein n=1 Tax=unclassified Pseudopelagicola TaxID=2649563 RepID=UPI003EBB83FB